jgi:hypothetical protein
LTAGRRVGTDGNDLRTETLNLPVILLQLAELRAAEPSSLCPIKDYENRLLALEGIQTDGRALNRKPADVRGHDWGLKSKQQSYNQRLHNENPTKESQKPQEENARLYACSLGALYERPSFLESTKMRAVIDRPYS